MRTIKRLLPVAAVAAAVLTVAACGSQEPATPTANTPAAGSTSSTASPGPSSAPPAPGTGIAPGEPDPNGGSKGPGGNVPGVVKLLPASQVDTKELPNFGKAPQVSVGDGGKTLRITIAKTTGCATMQGIVKQQNTDGVWVALVPMDTPQGGEKCSESMTPKPALVRLDAPLDTRTDRKSVV